MKSIVKESIIIGVLICLFITVGYANDGSVYIEKESSYIEPITLDVADWDIQLNKPMTSSIVVADVTGDGNKEIIATTYGMQPNPYWGGFVHVLGMDGIDIPGFPRETGSPFSSSAVVGDVDKDGDMEIAVGCWDVMFLLNHDGSSYPGWPLNHGVNYAPVMVDFNADDTLEIVFSTGNILYVKYINGSNFGGFPVGAPDDIGSAAVGDIDNDGILEIVAGTLAGPVGPDPYEIYAWELDGSVMDGFPVATSGTVKSTPALGDVNNDGYLEIVVAAYHTSNQDYIYCIDHEGNNLSGWPIRADYVRLSSPALTDIDQDNDLEIFIGGLTTSGGFTEILFGFDHEGNQLDNWPVLLPHDGGAGNINSSPIVAEIDDELESPEILVRTYNNIFGLNADGSLIDGFPFPIDDDNSTGTHTPSPAIADMDDDGDADMIFGTPSGRIYYLDWAGTFDEDLTHWPMYKHDRWGWSRYGADEQTSVDAEVILPDRIELMQNYPNPFNASTTLSFSIDEPGFVELSIYDLLGRKVSTIVNQELNPGSYSFNFDASALPSGVFFYRLNSNGFSETKMMSLVK